LQHIGNTATLTAASVVVPFANNLLLNPRHARAPGGVIASTTPFRFDAHLWGAQKVADHKRVSCTGAHHTAEAGTIQMHAGNAQPIGCRHVHDALAGRLRAVHVELHTGLRMRELYARQVYDVARDQRIAA
jgi:hypothetical protein